MSLAAVVLSVAAVVAVIAWSATAAALAPRFRLMPTLSLLALSAPPFLALVAVAGGAAISTDRFGVPSLLRDVTIAIGLIAAVAWVVIVWKGSRRHEWIALGHASLSGPAF